MGFASRSVSLIRYRVKGQVEGSFWDSIDEGVRSWAFKPTGAPGDVVAIGWVSMADFTDSEFSSGSCIYGSYVALALRIDTVRVPARILELNFKAETNKLLQQTGRRRLSSAESRDLKDRLKETLKHNVFPSIQLYEMMWNTAEAVVYLGSHSVKAREFFEDHFKKSFRLSLAPLIPYVRAQELVDGPSQRLLEELRPCIMAP